MKLPAGPLKVIFISRGSLVENRDRSVVRGAKLVPPWIVFVHTPGDDTVSPTVPAKTEAFHAHSFDAVRLTPKTDFRSNRPYPWIPSTRPGYPGESLIGTNVWLETKGELVIDTEDKFNV